MSQVAIAESRRGSEVQRLTRQIESLEREIGAGVFDRNGAPNPYLMERREWLQSEVKRLNAEVERMGNLTNEQMISEFVPEVAAAEAAADQPRPSVADVTNRGASITPEIRLVNHAKPYHRPASAEPGVPWDQMGKSRAVPGHTMGYDKDGNLVPLD
jgi:hypothetical protein